MTLDENVSALKDLAEEFIKKSIIKWLLLKLPFLSWGVFNPIVAFGVGKLASFIVKEGEIGAFFLYTDFRVGKQKDAYISSAEKYLSIKATGTPEEVAIAKKDFVDSSSRFISLST